MLHAVGVLAVASVSRTTTRLNVGRTPGARTQAPKRGSGVESSCTYFVVVGLQHHTALICPILLKAKDDLLETERLISLLR